MLDDHINKLNDICAALPDTTSLQKSLKTLIIDINLLKGRLETTTPKIISFSFFDTVSEKLCNQRRLVTEMELETVCTKTDALLRGQISIEQFKKDVANCEGQASPQINLISEVFLIVGALVLLSAFVAKTLPLMIITAGVGTAFLISGHTLFCKSGKTGLSKETNDVLEDYIAYNPALNTY